MHWCSKISCVLKKTRARQKLKQWRHNFTKKKSKIIEKRKKKKNLYKTGFNTSHSVNEWELQPKIRIWGVKGSVDGILLRRNLRREERFWLNWLDRILAERWPRWPDSKGRGFDQTWIVIGYWGRGFLLNWLICVLAKTGFYKEVSLVRI